MRCFIPFLQGFFCNQTSKEEPHPAKRKIYSTFYFFNSFLSAKIIIMHKF